MALPSVPAKPVEATAQQTDARGRVLIGQNANGQDLWEDQNGVRSIKQDGIVQSEPVGIAPGTRTLSVDRIRHPEFALASEQSQLPVPAEKPAASALGATQTPSSAPDNVPQAIADHLYERGSLSRQEAARIAGVQVSDKDQSKNLEEQIEHGVVLAARHIVDDGASPQDTLNRLVKLYDDQPRLTSRTSTSVAQQAYSTPAPLAYVASKLADIHPGASVLEPSAGNGMLLMAANPKDVTANEINPRRQAVLKSQGFNVEKADAAKPDLWSPKSFDRVIANPPFGAVRNESGNGSKHFDMGDIQPGYKTHEVDHAIALRALQAMKDDGQAALILGGVNKLASDRTGAYTSKAKREFYNTLYRNYNVTDHFTVPGELYAKQGAGWPVDVIRINGRGQSSLQPPMRQAPPVLSSWQEIGGRLALRGYAGIPAQTGEQSPQAAGAGRRPAPTARPNAGSVSVPHGEQPAAGRPARPEQPTELQRDGVSGQRGAGQSGGEPDAGPRKDDHGAGLAGGHDQPHRAALRVTPEEATESQVSYKPGAKNARSLGTLTPRNMAEPTERALNGLIARHGNLEDYISDRLGMPREQVNKAFSAEQVDGLSMAIDNIEKGGAAIIGDATGIGKGRIAAGVLAYAKREGKIPIFVTEKPNLYTDMHRDLTAIGVTDPKILMTNRTIVGGGLELENGTQMKPTRNADALLRGLAETGEMPEHDFLFTTYSQMDPVAHKTTDRRRAITAIAPKSVFVFDEAHNVGESSERAGDDSVPLRAQFFRDIVDHAGGVAYLSATYAKRPGNMDFYRRTDMRHAVEKPEAMGEAFGRGGIPMQEIVASMLADAGQYIRRERSFKGINYETKIAPINHQMVSEFGNALRSVNDFSNSLQEPLKAMKKRLAADAKGFGLSGGATGTAGINSVKFSSLMHNLIGQVLLASNVRTAADEAIKAIGQGKRPVIALANTMATLIEDEMKEAGRNVGDPTNMTFNYILHRYLSRSRDINIDKGFGRGSERHHLTDDEIGPVAQDLYQRAREAIDAVNFGDLPVSPIDYIHNALREAGYKSGEITGRSIGIDYSGDHPVYMRRDQREISPSGRTKTIADYNAGRLDNLVINAAGSTGLSLHDSADFPKAGRGPRHMILAQANPDPNVFMQTLGRINRTGQVSKPSYAQIAADAPAETRTAAVLQKKMASLNANTTAAQDSSVLKEDIPDFLNKYGDQVVREMMAEDPDLHAKMGSPLGKEVDDRETDGSAVRKVTGHISLLDYPEQEKLMKGLVARYRDLMQALEDAGENTLSTPTLDLDAKYLNGDDLVPETGSSPFQAAAHLGTYDVKSSAKPMKFDTVRSMAATNIGLKPDELPEDPRKAMDRIAMAGRGKMNELSSTAEKAFGEYFRKTIANRSDEESAKRTRDALLETSTFMKQAFAALPVGFRVTLGMPDGSQRTGYVADFTRKGASANPMAPSDFTALIATPGAKAMRLPLSRIVFGDAAADKIGVKPFNSEDHAATAARFDSFKGDMRERRVIATGNLLSAYDRLSNTGRIVRFTDEHGALRQGIMLSERAGDAKDVVNALGKRAQSPDEVLDNAPIEARGTQLRVSKFKDRHTGEDSFQIAVPAAKAVGGHFFLDPALTSAAGKDFVRAGKEMVLHDLSRQAAHDVIRRLQSDGVVFMISQNKP